jgi:hypothetical protein
MKNPVHGLHGLAQSKGIRQVSRHQSDPHLSQHIRSRLRAYQTSDAVTCVDQTPYQIDSNKPAGTGYQNFLSHHFLAET